MCLLRLGVIFSACVAHTALARATCRHDPLCSMIFAGFSWKICEMESTGKSRVGQPLLTYVGKCSENCLL